MSPATTCRQCGAPLIPSHRWHAADPATRDTWRAAGRRRHHGRSLCESCYAWARAEDTLADTGAYPRLRRDGDQLVEAWTQLDAVGVTRRQAATLLGVTYGALGVAICRHRQTPTPPPERTPS
ncbi:MAG: hypothetical protein ACRDP1_13275 [Nocardioidaceae bacterium]